MVAGAVAADEEEFVEYVGGGFLVEGEELAPEALPLGEIGTGGAAVGAVGLVDQAEVGGSVVEGRGIGCVQVLKEVTLNSRVLDVLRAVVHREAGGGGVRGRGSRDRVGSGGRAGVGCGYVGGDR